MIKKLIYKLADRLTAWHQRHLTGVDFLFVSSFIIGLMCGVGAALLKYGIGLVTHVIFEHFHFHHINLLFFILPIAGIFIAALFATYIVRCPMDHASERIIDAVANNRNNLSPRLILGPIIGNSLTLGLGGSAGTADPIALTGAAIGSNVGKAFRLPQETLGQMMGCGAAAAIGGIFMAPIGGVMFALEVLKMKQSLKTVLAIVLASLIAALTSYLLMGCHTDVSFVPEMRFDLNLIPWVLLCGLFCGLYSLYYINVMRWCRTWLRRIANKWIRALVGGAFLACLLVLFPSLYGEGYGTMQKLMVNDPITIVTYGPLYKLGLDFDVLLVLLAVLLLVKPLATSATNDSGGVGGDFTPTLFAGCVAGFLFAVTLNHFFGMHLPYALFAFFGMAAVMAGAIRAPLMAIFMAAEMTGLYGFILPLTICALGSFLATLVFCDIHVPLPFLHNNSKD